MTRVIGNAAYPDLGIVFLCVRSTVGNTKDNSDRWISVSEKAFVYRSRLSLDYSLSQGDAQSTLGDVLAFLGRVFLRQDVNNPFLFNLN